MSDDPALAPTEWPPGLAWEGHLLLVHDSEAERRAQVAAWAAAGLAGGYRILYVVDDTPGAPADPLLDVLAGHGVDGGAAVGAGALVLVPATEYYPEGAPEELVQRAIADGYRGARISGEAAAALTTLSPEEYREAELATRALCHGHRASTLCQYDVTLSSGWTLADTVEVHLQDGIRHRLLRSAAGPGRLEVAGEVDASDAYLFAELLRAAGRAGPPGELLTVDLTGLRWISAAGLHALACGTADFRGAGGRVQLQVTPASAVDRTIRLLDLNLPAGIELGGA